MTNDLENLLAAPGLESTAFDESSRYYGLETRQHVDENGMRRTYVARRLVPRPEAFTSFQVHVVVDGDRVDNLAFNYLGDPLYYWRIADANVALRPAELTSEVNRKLRITLPAGVPGEDIV